MRSRCVLMLIVGTLGLSCLVHSQVPADSCTEVFIVDKTAPGSPIELTGSVTLCDREEGKQIAYRYEGQVRLHSIASTGVVGMVVTLDLQYVHGPKDSRRLLDDAFFGEGAMPAGSTTVHKLGSGVRKGPLPSGRMFVPSAIGNVVFAQFEDGSWFGEPALAADLLEIRGQRIAALRSLEAAYVRGGEREFRDLLENVGRRSDLEIFLERYRRMEKRSGTALTVSAVRKALTAANGRREIPIGR